MVWYGMALAALAFYSCWWKVEGGLGMWDVPVSSWDKTAYLLQHAKGSISKGRSRSRSRSTTTSPAPQESENLKTETEP